MVWELTRPWDEHTAVILLNGHSIKVPFRFKPLYPWVKGSSSDLLMVHGGSYTNSMQLSVTNGTSVSHPFLRLRED